VTNIQKMMNRGVQMQCAKKWFTGTIIITLCLLLFLSPFTKSSADSMAEFNKLDYFYPKIYCLPDSFPYLYFQIGNFVHVRSAETGLLVKIYELKKDERIIKFDENSVLTLDIYDHTNNKQIYRRFDIDGTIEEFTMSWEDTSISGTHNHDIRYAFIDNQPIQICLSMDIITISETEEKKEYKLYAENKDGILWEKIGIDGIGFHLPRNNISNSKFIHITKSQYLEGRGYVDTNQITNIHTGGVIYSTDGFYYMNNKFLQDQRYISLHPYSNKKDLKTKIIDTRTGKVVYEPTSDYMPFFF